MQLYLYRGHTPNFGDDLNAYLFPRLLDGFFDDDPAALFLGIGSILFDTHPAAARKIVFGSGYGGYTAPPVLDRSWDISFVRGPRTAALLGLDASLSVGDSAMLVATLGLARRPVRGRVAYMPHVDSATAGDWERVAGSCGMRFIDPRGKVEDVLSELLAADKVVTDSMHGAIVADALRIPWVATRPLFAVHRPKWIDWAESLDLTVRSHSIAPSNALEAMLVAVKGKRGMERQLRWRLRNGTSLGAGLFGAQARRALRLAASAEPQLSSDAALGRAVARMQAALKKRRQDR